LAATAANPLGKILLVIVLIGLCIYVLWALCAALFDLLHEGHDLKGLFKRAVLLGERGNLRIADSDVGSLHFRWHRYNGSPEF